MGFWGVVGQPLPQELSLNLALWPVAPARRRKGGGDCQGTIWKYSSQRSLRLGLIWGPHLALHVTHLEGVVPCGDGTEAFS